MKSLQALTQDEKQLLESTRNQIASVDSGALIAEYSLDGRQFRFGGATQYNIDGLKISKKDDNNFSASRSNLPNNISRVFVNNDLVTYVYHDDQVQMKPSACLQADEQQLIRQIKVYIHQAEQRDRFNVANFERDIQKMQENFRRTMQDLFPNLKQR